MKFTSNEPRILVIGSSSVDLVLDTHHIPEANETVIAHHSETFFGGKGANQAVGTSRLGASTYFMGAVGMDPYGQQIMRHLVHEKVNVGFVIESEDAPTGTAYVTNAENKNAIVVVPAANYSIKKQDIIDSERVFDHCDLVLLQLEIPMEIIEFVFETAISKGKKIGLYASPGKQISQQMIQNSDFIVVKSSELSLVFGENSKDTILKEHPNKVFIRDHFNSTIYFDGSEMKFYRDESQLISKMGMGDAFVSGFSVAMLHDNPINECVKFGNLVASKAAQKRGSQTGLPFLKEL